MSRDFKEEYQNMLTAELPDLWGRIEAGLDVQQTEKKSLQLQTAGGVTSSAVVMQSAGTDLTIHEGGAKETDSPSQKDSSRKKRGTIRRFYPYAALIAAAAIIFLVAIPISKLGRNRENATASMMTDSAVMPQSVPAEEKSSETATSTCEEVVESFDMTNGAEYEYESDSLAMEPQTYDAEEAETDDEVIVSQSFYNAEATAGVATDNGAQQGEAAATAEQWDNSDREQITEETLTTGQASARGIIIYHGTEVANSSIIVDIAPGTRREQLEELMKQFHLTIRYDFSDYGSYAFDLETPVADEEEMDALINALKKIDFVGDVSTDGIVHTNMEGEGSQRY